MGIVADHARLTIGGANTVWEYGNMPGLAKKLEPAGKHDACYVPRRIHVTGDIDIQELARDGNNEPWMVNTRFCRDRQDARFSALRSRRGPIFPSTDAEQTSSTSTVLLFRSLNLLP
jgi:hypothetical protein